MATEQNNIHVNQFNEGMDSDSTISELKNTKYTLGLNVRITDSKRQADDGSIQPEEKDGVLGPVSINTSTLQGNFTGDDSTIDCIFKTVTCGTTTLILYKTHKNSNYYINVAEIQSVDTTSASYKLTFLFRILGDYKNTKNISVVLNKELNSVLKLYIADGIHSIMQINVLDNDYIKNITNKESVNDTVGYIKPEHIEQNSFFPVKKAIINNKISGQLKTSQVQYTYRFYKKYGIKSKLAPLTNKIQVISNNKDIEKGNAEDTNTNIGFQIVIPDIYNTDVITESYKNVFDHYQLYRIQYLKANQNPEIHLISDGLLQDNLKINDITQDSLQVLSLDEYSALDGQSLVPQVIEQNQNYLFLGGINDKTSFTLYYKDGVNDATNEDGDQVIDFSTYSVTTVDDAGKSYYIYTDGSGVDYSALISTDGNIKDTINQIKSEIKAKGLNPDNVYNSYTDINKYKIYSINDISYTDAYKNPDIGQQSMFTPFYNSNNRSDTYYVGGFNELIQWRLVTFEFMSSDKDIDASALTQMKYMYYNTATKKLDLKSTDNTLSSYIREKNINIADNYFSDNDYLYKDIYTSSLVRSLKRGETYRYGIVFYDKYGNKSNVYFIADIKVPFIGDFDIDQNGRILPIGVEFSLNTSHSYLKLHNIVGYEIVRCDKPEVYTRNIRQCVLAKPIIQSARSVKYNGDGVNTATPIGVKLDTPFYASGILSSQPLRYYWKEYTNENDGIKESGYIWNELKQPWPNDVYGETRCNQTIFQLFNPQFLYNRETQIDIVNTASNIQLLKYIYSDKTISDIHNFDVAAVYYDSNASLQTYSKLYINRCEIKCDRQSKENTNTNVFYFDKSCTKIYTSGTTNVDVDMNYNITTFQGCYNFVDLKQQEISYTIKSIKDSKTIGWNEIFSQVQLDGDVVKTAIKQYKNFIQNIGTSSYVNFVCCGKYNGKIGKDSEALFPDGTGWPHYTELSSVDIHNNRQNYERGPICTGGQCFIADIIADMPINMAFNPIQRLILIDNYDASTNTVKPGTFICNLQHTASQFSGVTKQQKQYDIYYGFGNYKYIEDYQSYSTNDVFDGTVYIAPFEFVTSHIAYNFNDKPDALQSMSVINYVTMEDETNPYFAYGMSYRNTNNKNIQQKSSVIDGVYSQDRPAYQYNNIYSDNDTSISTYNVQSYETLEQNFPSRICYSQLKTIGENIDNWQIFKAADYIDCNSKYGNITDLFTTRDILYCWQQKSFGKLSVNERSLVTDNNNNTVQLGQGSVLQRIDYISDKYGMRIGDMCKIDCEGMLLWFDYMNRCIVLYQEGRVGNYTEQKNVNNIIHNYNDDQLPRFAYDMSHNELHFQNIKMLDQMCSLIFNVKYGVATSLYTLGDNNFGTINVSNNNCFNLYKITESGAVIKEYSKLYKKHQNMQYLTPMYIKFVVNTNPSVTKVFDNQQIVYTNRRNVMENPNFFATKFIHYQTDLSESYNYFDKDKTFVTDREGNICFPIPRIGQNSKDTTNIYNTGYGQRLRGKWMEETYTEASVGINSTLNYIITKFRQSYS